MSQAGHCVPSRSTSPCAPVGGRQVISRQIAALPVIATRDQDEQPATPLRNGVSVSKSDAEDGGACYSANRFRAAHRSLNRAGRTARPVMGTADRRLPTSCPVHGKHRPRPALGRERFLPMTVAARVPATLVPTTPGVGRRTTADPPDSSTATLRHQGSVPSDVGPAGSGLTPAKPYQWDISGPAGSIIRSELGVYLFRIRFRKDRLRPWPCSGVS